MTDPAQAPEPPLGICDRNDVPHPQDEWNGVHIPGHCQGWHPVVLTGDCSIDCLEGCAYPGQFSECEP
jgi:hypothetical protein